MGTKKPYLGIFGLEFEKAIVIFEISTSNLINWETLLKTKMSKFGTKMPYLGIFELEFQKGYCHI